MKMMKKAIFGLIIAVAVAGTVAAGGTKSGEETTTARQAAGADVKWDNDSVGYLTVNNNVNEPLILFAGTLTNQHILGGVRALATRRIDFFSQVTESNGTFLLRAVKESVYRSKGSQLASDDIIFAGLVVYDKGNPRDTQVNINKVLGGEARVLIQNDTLMVMQIRLDRPDGPTLTTLAPLERNKIVYLEPNPEGYFFFPIYEYYDPSSMGIRSITPRDLADGTPMRPEVKTAGGSTPTVEFLPFSMANLFSPFATLVVTNETTRGAYLLEGSSRKMSQSGNTMINPGSETFELNLQKQSFLRIGGLNVDLSLGAANHIRIPEYEYEAGYNYQVRVRQGAVPEVIRLGKSDTNNLSIQLVNEQ
jgi:hypothetical protein